MIDPLVDVLLCLVYGLTVVSAAALILLLEVGVRLRRVCRRLRRREREDARAREAAARLNDTLEAGVERLRSLPRVEPPR